MPSSPQRPLAPHVQAAIARGAQPKMAPAPPGRRIDGGRLTAPHVQRALAAPVQPKVPVKTRAGQQTAPHVQRAIAGPIQAKAAGPGQSAPLAAHVARSLGRQPGPPPAIQRQIDYGHGTKSRQIDPIESMIRGVDFGITRVRLNGARIPPAANATGAISASDFQVHASGERTTVSIRRVATQNVSYEMELPVSPPWTRSGVAKGLLKGALEMQLPRDTPIRVPIESTESGTISVELKGHPDDDTFAALVERHEKYHVKDLEETIHDILRPWDTMLQRLAEAGTRFEEASQGRAEEAAYRAAGGTPREIGERFGVALRDKGIAFHRTATGGSPMITGVEKSTFGGTLRVYVRHPAELEQYHARELRREAEERRRQEAMDEATQRFDARRAVGDVTIGSSSQGNRYISNDML